jgi:hypothetical protein
MAASSIAQSTRVKPSPDDVIRREYLYQANTGGKRGAYRRTAERVGRSDEYVRKLVKAQDKPTEQDTGTDYIPCPGEEELRAQRAQLATLPPPIANDPAPETPTDANDITSTPSSLALPSPTPLPTDERSTPVIAAPPVAIVYGGSRSDPNADALPFLVALVALGATLSVMLTALVSVGLAMAWVPFPLLLWWIVARLRAGVVRRCRVDRMT